MPPEAFGPAEFQAATWADDARMADMAAFLALLAEWNQRMNLVGPSALQTFWLRHAWDSAQLLSLRPDVRRWADVGAGAGFPGLVLAILLKGVEGGHVHLIESMTKRCRFLSDVVERLSLPAQVHNARAETARIPPVEVVTARACAPAERLFQFTEPFFKAGARGLFLKGREVAAELDQARRVWRFEASLLPSLSDPSGQVLSVERLARVR